MSLLRVEVACGSEKEAASISTALLETRLVACAQIHPVTSRYWWDGKIDTAQEVLLVMKTIPDKFDDLSKLVRKLHSYDLPEITAVEIKHVSEDYLNWVQREVR